MGNTRLLSWYSTRRLYMSRPPRKPFRNAQTLGFANCLQIPPSCRSVATVESLLGNNQRPPVLGSDVCFSVCFGSIGSNDASDGHEESSVVLLALETSLVRLKAIPKCGSGHEHILAQCSHDAVWPCAVSENGGRACPGSIWVPTPSREPKPRPTKYEADDDANGCDFN
jgi:hypothetical protein